MRRRSRGDGRLSSLPLGSLAEPIEHTHTNLLRLGPARGGRSCGQIVENKKIAILISVLALFLAIAETLGKSAQTDALKYNVEASNLWSFFQAKTIRQTTMETAAEQMEVDIQLAKDPSVRDLLEKRANSWKTRAARYESEPETQEGRKELMARAKALGEKSDHALAKYHNFEFGSAAFQIAIVLASSYLITGVVYLLWGAGGLGAIGILFTLIGAFAPNALHLFGAH